MRLIKQEWSIFIMFNSWLFFFFTSIREIICQSKVASLWISVQWNPFNTKSEKPHIRILCYPSHTSSVPGTWTPVNLSGVLYCQVSTVSWPRLLKQCQNYSKCSSRTLLSCTCCPRLLVYQKFTGLSTF